MTKLILINPPISLEERYGEFALGGSYAPPLGLCVLAAFAKKNNIETEIIDSAALNLSNKQIIDILKNKNPDVIGITAVTMSIYNAVNLAEYIKKEFKNLPIILGGPHITAVPEETIKRFNCFDVGVIGEGEITLVELIKTILKLKSLNKVKGIIYKKNNKVIKTPCREFIENLDELPFPALDLLPKLQEYYRPPLFSYKQLPSTSIITSRGCPGQCTFCDRSVFGNRVRGFSAEYVVSMIKDLYYNYGIRDILIDDDTFMIMRNRLKEICNLLIKEKLNLSWACNSRSDHVNLEILKLMKKAGCWQIAYGLESGSQKILDTIKKGVTVQQNYLALKWSKSVGIQTKGFFMIGHPNETKKTISETINFALNSDLDDFQITMFTPLPGSEIYNYAKDYGKMDYNWKKMNMWNIVFVPKNLTENELKRYQSLAFRKFYLRPKIFYSYLKRINNFSDIFKVIKGGLVLIKSAI